MKFDRAAVTYRSCKLAKTMDLIKVHLKSIKDILLIFSSLFCFFYPTFRPYRCICLISPGRLVGYIYICTFGLSWDCTILKYYILFLNAINFLLH